MSEKIWSSEKIEGCIENIINKEFLYISNIPDFSAQNDYTEIKLCIVNTDFSTEDIVALKQIIKSLPNSEIWASCKSISRENVVAANSLGIKNVVSSPFDKKTVKDFFIKKLSFPLKQKPTENDKNLEVEGMKVLIADDNFMNVRLLETILEDFNLEISSFLKPEDALKAIEKERFDLFLLDIMMPEISGFDLAQKIKESEENKYSPIIFISALSDSQTQINSYHFGSYAYIEKPYDINIVKSQIYGILKNLKMQKMLTSTKESFLATVAHDMKTPLSAEMTALKLLLDETLGNLDNPQKEIIEDMMGTVNFLRDMVENLLCRNKIEVDKMHIDKHIYSLKELVQKCIITAEYVLKEKNQKIIFKCEPNNIFLPIDILEIKRVLNNLIANASQYSPDGSDIIIEISCDDKMAKLSVQDFGNGIDLKNKDDVFIKYMTEAKKYKRIGTGLGLYISKKIVEAHGGSTSVESEVGQGTKISIYLPLY